MIKETRIQQEREGIEETYTAGERERGIEETYIRQEREGLKRRKQQEREGLKSRDSLVKREG